MNGYRSPIIQINQLKSIQKALISPSLDTISGNPKQFEMACEILGVDSLHLETIKPVREHEAPHADFLLGGILARRKHISKTSRYCPVCFGEKPYFRKIWDYKLYSTCHIHDVELIEFCSRCQEPITWNRRYIGRCSCGEDFAHANSFNRYSYSSKLLFEIYESGNRSVFDLLIDFSLAIADHYKTDRYSNKALEYAAMGVKQPDRLAKKLVDEIEADPNTSFHPIISFQAFRTSTEPSIRELAELASRLISYKPQKALQNNLTEADLLSTRMAAKLLGIKPKQLKALCEIELLEIHQHCPSSAAPVTKRSINDLVMSLSKLEEHSNLPSLSIENVISASENCIEQYNLTQIIRLLLDGHLRLVKFCLNQPLSKSMIEIPGLTPLPTKEELPMVWVADLARVMDIHANELRELISSTPGISHFPSSQLKMQRQKKYLIPSHAYRLLEIFQSRKRGEKIEYLTRKDIPITNVTVQKLENPSMDILRNKDSMQVISNASKGLN
jgi:plasmid maintenance system antidote protein VapI